MGTSGFSYPEWRGGFYPRELRPEEMLGYYAERLPAVELNNSFYRTPPAETMSRWAATVPSEFRFCLKAHRAVTYASAAFDRPGLAAELTKRLEPLGERCGPVLLQFPPVRQVDPGLLDSVIKALARPAAVEFRHESWFVEPVFDVLRRHAAALVVTDQEKWPQAPRLESGPVAYLRLRRDYDEAGLSRWATVVREELDARDAVYVFFKHDPQAPARAQQLEAATSS